MKILVIGGGGREHAIAWKLAQSSQVREVHCAPGNAGTALEHKVVNHPANTPEAWLALAKHLRADVVVIGPELPLSLGLVDALQELTIRVIGPQQRAAMLESSKSFAKQMMVRAGIPTASFEVFTSAQSANDYIKKRNCPLVIKADGLAAGKGVVIAKNIAEANEAIDQMMVKRVFGVAGDTVVIEECLQGEEASFIVLTDGDRVAPFNSAQDHKRLLAGDHGPNTGGMGAYVPAPVVSVAMRERILDRVIHPLLATLKKEFPEYGNRSDPRKRLYAGFLYAGVMIDRSGMPQVLEFNCRLGDPETQPLMWGLEGDLAETLYSVTDGTLDENALARNAGATIGVVLASGGYPQSVLSDCPIEGIHRANQVPQVKVFHAGTYQQGQEVRVNGGRVLCVTARGDDLRQARESAYSAIAHLSFDGMQYRNDIGHRAL
jgi:phosphoribosylamine--glycine ligase